MDERYLYVLHCFADPAFYEAPERILGGRPFSVSARPPPPGWTRAERGVWVGLSPEEPSLPPQGWKIHISACLDNAEGVLGKVWDYCCENKLAFKFLRSTAIHLLTNSKYADRGSSGKLATLYPAGTEALERTLKDLGELLDGQRGPYILSDLRWRLGPVYVRYGGFLDRHWPSETGDLLPAVARPDGQLVADARGPVFQVPSWVELPAFLAQATDTGTGSSEDFPYDVERPLHFSNGGGVYLATDRATGQRVVLKEARPYAGLDGDGVDAVARLDRERATLESLSDLDVAPGVHGHFRCWEHHFLVEDYVEGDPLSHCVAERLPLSRANPSETEITDYTDWALAEFGRIEQALDAVHGRGLLYGDLSPRNIMVRPDGGIVFLDFEVSCRLDDSSQPASGTPGFTAAPSCSGIDIDRYALACLGLWMFVPPLTFLMERDPAKMETFLRVVGKRFPVPDTFLAKLRRQLRAGLPTSSQGSPDVEPGSGGARPSPRRAGQGLERLGTDWTTESVSSAALADSIAQGIASSATPHRQDRLFPGDVAQFRYGGLNLAYGAAGVLWSLAVGGFPVDPDHVEWLVEASRRDPVSYVGLYNGLHGVAYVLDYLGRREDAIAVVERSMGAAAKLRARGLFGGVAGIGLSLLHFGSVCGDGRLAHGAEAIAEQLAAWVQHPEATPDRPSAAGLMYGFSGAALLFIRLYERTHDSGLLDLAAHALRRDLGYCRAGSDGALQVREGQRLMPYLAVGSAGIGLVIAEFLTHRDDEELAIAQRNLQGACQVEFVLFSGLFNGRAGLISYLALAPEPGAPRDADPALALHLHRLGLHAVSHRGHVAFPGDQLLRLSMDLATGSAGVLLAIATAQRSTALFLPFFAPHAVARERAPATT